MIRKVSTLGVLMILVVPAVASDRLSAAPSRLTPVTRNQGVGHQLVRLTSAAGPSRIATLDGVGCSEVICSRVGVRTQAVTAGARGFTLLRFDTVAAITMRQGGRATVELTDGSSREVLIPSDNRVLYLLDDGGRPQQVELGDLAAVEFLR